MKLNGDHILTAPREIIWSMLMNPEQLAKITPGISELIREEENSFKAISEVKIGPVKGKFSGNVLLENINEPNSFDLNVKQNSKVGNVQAVVSIHLEEMGQDTKLSFEGDAKLSGLLARTGARVVSGVANSLTRQFFEAFQKELDEFSGT